MKPTSIIFIILAGVLIVAGVIVCVVGGVMANSGDGGLISDTVTTEGDDITTYSVTENKLTNIDIDIKNADIKIIGQSTTCKVEVKNVNAATYTCDFSTKNGKLSIETVNPFDISEMLKFKEGGKAGFDGLRHYLFLGKYKEKVAEITVYITPSQSLSDVKVKVTGGDVTVMNMIGDTDYTLQADKGNAIFENNVTEGNLEAKVKGGNFTFSLSSAGHTDFTVDKGNGKFITNRQFNYYCECESGKVYINDENVGESYEGVYPEAESDEEAELPKTVKGKITSGELTIDTKE